MSAAGRKSARNRVTLTIGLRLPARLADRQWRCSSLRIAFGTIGKPCYHRNQKLLGRPSPGAWLALRSSASRPAAAFCAPRPAWPVAVSVRRSTLAGPWPRGFTPWRTPSSADRRCRRESPRGGCSTWPREPSIRLMPGFTRFPSSRFLTPGRTISLPSLSPHRPPWKPIRQPSRLGKKSSFRRRSGLLRPITLPDPQSLPPFRLQRPLRLGRRAFFLPLGAPIGSRERR